ncbi:MAG: bifunctional phosphopantothenoylcysteine decarboxylase/phosphopantothenate synthase [Alphaproteobacteria bacterium]|nr:bifunctional phosphopantothenoylcysteine decarboxylase/phosphopantothenate synthase [Alphaproteobacteria bacterium]
MSAITLIISGSIAAIKASALISLLRQKKISVHCIVTRGGSEFVNVKELEKLSGNPVSTDLFSPKEKKDMWHIRFSRETDLLLVAPATADIIAKMVHGIADDMATATLLANNKKLLVAPAMNTQMWRHPATQRNVKQIEKDGAVIIEPGVGMLACGETGQGRMAEPQEIVEVVLRTLSPAGRRQGEGGKRHNPHPNPLPERERGLKGITALVTSGPTHESIDPVRYIANRSSGKQGHAIAAALARAGVKVTLVSGPTQLADPAGVSVVHVTTAREMYEAVQRALPVDVAVFAAAVGDWHVKPAAQKIKKQTGKKPALELEENPDILKSVAQHKTKRPRLVVGFAAETEKLESHAAKKYHAKGADWVLANDVSGGKVFGDDENQVIFISKDGQHPWPKMSKTKVAERLAREIILALSKKKEKKRRQT